MALAVAEGRAELLVALLHFVTLADAQVGESLLTVSGIVCEYGGSYEADNQNVGKQGGEEAFHDCFCVGKGWRLFV